ncbi:hypothetical protein DPMN_156467 [Dreissena polymorpha]|uniref:Uncharacterized protein n=1 Tax=Dreissena polymorpha TaxID=45954 RepID=A0A9D4FT80_DREPO|nr:hypothetical protein DPMN_156467 [Dreissena polymorpha]
MKHITKIEHPRAGFAQSIGRQASYDKEMPANKPLLNTDALCQSVHNDSATLLTHNLYYCGSLRHDALPLESPSGLIKCRPHDGGHPVSLLGAMLRRRRVPDLSGDDHDESEVLRRRFSDAHIRYGG